MNGASTSDCWRNEMHCNAAISSTMHGISAWHCNWVIATAAALFVIIQGYPIQRSSAAQFQVEGVMRMIPTNVNLPRAHISEYYMTVAVSNCSWTILRREAGLAAFEVGCDGTNVYSIIRAPRGAGSIDPGVYPISASPEIAIAYLAYASSCYFSPSNQGYIPKLNVAERRLSYTLYSSNKAAWVRFPDQLGLLQELTHLGNPQGLYRDLPRDFPYEVLTATDFVPVKGFSIPLEVSYVHNGIHHNSKENRFFVMPTFTYLFRVTNYSDVVSVNPGVPLIPAGTVLVDSRFSSQENPMPPITLTAGTNRWPTEDEITNTAMYTTLAKQQWEPIRITAKRPSKYKLPLFIGLLLVSILPSIFVLRRKLKTRT